MKFLNTCKQCKGIFGTHLWSKEECIFSEFAQQQRRKIEVRRIAKEATELNFLRLLDNKLEQHERKYRH